MVLLNCQELGGYNSHNNELGQSSSQGDLIQWELWRWFILYDIPGSKIDGLATKTLLNLQNEKQSSLNEQDAESSCSNTKSSLFGEFLNLSQFSDLKFRD